MTDLNTLTQYINSPPAQFVAGIVVGGAVMKAFGKWEKLSSESDKIQIWMWLAQPGIATSVEKWPQTFTRLFDRVFGEKHFSWRCFRRSCLATLIACLITVLGLFAYFRPFAYTGFPGEKSFSGPSILTVLLLAIPAAIVLCLFDYASLLETRFVLRLLQRWSSWYSVLILLLLDVVLTGVTGGIPVDLSIGPTLHPFQKVSQELADQDEATAQVIKSLEQDRAKLLAEKSELPETEKRLNELDRESDDVREKILHGGYGNDELHKRAAAIDKERDELSLKDSDYSDEDLSYVEGEIASENANQKSGFERKRDLLQDLSFWLPTFFTSIWLWLYAGCGFLLKAARRLDIGFRWFNRRFDVEKKPLESIGLVAGAFVTLVWWTTVIVAPLV
jgi:hypothetical protein